MRYFFLLMLCFFLCASATIMSGVTSHSLHRHLLHHYPFFPLDSSTSSSPSPSLPPQPSPEQPNYPFTSTTSSNPYPFFPSNPPPPPPSPPAVTSFPANISSLIFPNSSHHHHNNKLLTILISTSLSAFALLLLALLLLIYRRISRRQNAVVSHKPLRSENLEHTPSQTETATTTSDGTVKMIRPPPLRNGRGIIGTSTEFLYLGTVSGNSSSEINSPELRPLPPLPKFDPFISGEQITTPRSKEIAEVDEEFFSPRGSSSSGSTKFVEQSRSVNSKTLSFESSNSTSPTISLSDRTPAFVLRSPSMSSSSAETELGGPFVPPTRLSMDAQQIPKLKLKPLHWAKLGASSEKAIAWDDIKSTSFVLNEGLMESMFMMKSINLVSDDKGNVLPSANQENRDLDSRKLQNVAILLRASNITTDEVCEALLEGNADALGSELLECLLKMAPSKEEEQSLREFDDESQFKLGPDEKFLTILLDIPFAFERMEAMLYMTHFESEVEYVTQSFKTLQAACYKIKESKIFLKLLEAVLKAGNRINVGTNRGDAAVWNLDTLLKLVDEKGTDAITTLLHIVVEEIITDEGQTPNLGNQHDPQGEVESRKQSLQVVTSVIGELSNVNKAAEIDFTILSIEVEQLANQTSKVRHVLKLAEGIPANKNICKFTESITVFMNKAEAEITRIQVQQNTAFTLVKEVNEYFHGDYSKHEANPFRIFLVVRDFLSILDQVCKEVGKRNMRTIMGFGILRKPKSASAFPPFNRMQQSLTTRDQHSSSMNYGLTHSLSI